MTADVTIVVSGQNQASAALKAVQRDLAGIRNEASAAQRAAGAVGSALGSALKVGATAAAGAALALGGAMTAAAVKGVKASAALNQKMADTQAVLGATAEDTARLRDRVLELALDPTLKVSATEAAAAMEILAKNGLQVEQILGGATKATVLLSNATGSDMAFSADVATDAMQLFGMSAEQMETAVAGIVATTNNSKFDLQNYAQALAQGGVAAASVGVDFSEFNTLIGLSASNFASGARAGTSFRYLLTGLAGNTDKAKDAMKELGLITADGTNTFFDAKGELIDTRDIMLKLKDAFGGLSTEQRIGYVNTIFGMSAYGALNGILDANVEAYDDLLVKMTDVDALNRSAAIRQDTLSGKLEIFKSNLEGISLQIGDQFEPAMKQFVDSMTQLLPRVAPLIAGAFTIPAAIVNAAIPQIAIGAEAFVTHLENVYSTIQDIGAALRGEDIAFSIGSLFEFERAAGFEIINLAELATIVWIPESGTGSLTIKDIFIAEVDLKGEKQKINLFNYAVVAWNNVEGVATVHIADILAAEINVGGAKKEFNLFDYVKIVWDSAEAAGSVKIGEIVAAELDLEGDKTDLNLFDHVNLMWDSGDQAGFVKVGDLVVAALDLEGDKTDLNLFDHVNLVWDSGDQAGFVAVGDLVLASLDTSGDKTTLELADYATLVWGEGGATLDINSIVTGDIDLGAKLASVEIGEYVSGSLVWGEDIFITGSITDAIESAISVTSAGEIAVSLTAEHFDASFDSETGLINIGLGEEKFEIDTKAIISQINQAGQDIKTAYETAGIGGAAAEVGSLVVASIKSMWDTITLGVALMGGFIYNELSTIDWEQLQGTVSGWGTQIIQSIKDGLSSGVNLSALQGENEALGGEVAAGILAGVQSMWDTVKLGVGLLGITLSLELANLDTSELTSNVKETVTKMWAELTAGFTGETGGEQTFLETVGAFAATAKAKIVEQVEKVDVEGIRDMAANAAATIKTVSDAMTDALEGLDVGAAAQKFSEGLSSLAKTIETLAEARVDIVSALLDSLVSSITSFLQVVSDFTFEIDASAIADAATALSGALLTEIKTIANAGNMEALGSAAASLIGAIGVKFGEILSQENFGEELGKDIVGAAAAITSAVNAFGTTFANELAGFPWDTVSGQLTFATGLINGIMAALQEAATNWISAGDRSAEFEGLGTGEIMERLNAEFKANAGIEGGGFSPREWVQSIRESITSPLQELGRDPEVQVSSIDNLAKSVKAGAVDFQAAMNLLDAAGQIELQSALERLNQAQGNAAGATEATATAMESVDRAAIGAEGGLTMLQEGLLALTKLGLSGIEQAPLVGGAGRFATIIPLSAQRTPSAAGMEDFDRKLISSGTAITAYTEQVQAQRDEMAVNDAQVTEEINSFIESIKGFTTSVNQQEIKQDVPFQPLTVPAFDPVQQQQPLGTTIDVGALQSAGTQIAGAAETLSGYELEAPKLEWPPLPSWTWPTYPTFKWPPVPRPNWLPIRVKRPSWLGELLTWAPVVTVQAAANAIGTTYFSGGLTMVGETGPEMMLLPRGTRIYNPRETQEIESRQNASIVINATVSNPMDIETLAHRVADVVNRGAM